MRAFTRCTSTVCFLPARSIWSADLTSNERCRDLLLLSGTRTLADLSALYIILSSVTFSCIIDGHVLHHCGYTDRCSGTNTGRFAVDISVFPGGGRLQTFPSSRGGCLLGGGVCRKNDLIPRKLVPCPSSGLYGRTDVSK